MNTFENNLAKPKGSARRRMIVWEGGVKFGGLMATLSIIQTVFRYRSVLFPPVAIASTSSLSLVLDLNR